MFTRPVLCAYLQAEKERINRLGGAVIMYGGLYRVNGTLAVSRAIGKTPTPTQTYLRLIHTPTHPQVTPAIGRSSAASRTSWACRWAATRTFWSWAATACGTMWPRTTWRGRCTRKCARIPVSDAQLLIVLIQDGFVVCRYCWPCENRKRRT